jgi:hypothetical protein
LGAQAIRLPGSTQGRVDTVIVLKTLDAGSTFLDDAVFPKLPHVSRWGQEVSEKYKGNWPALVEWFDHKPGEEIVGGSMEFQAWQDHMLKTPLGTVTTNWVETVGKFFTKEKHGNTLFIKLYRHPVEKWVNLLRRDTLENVDCTDCRPENDGPKKGQKKCGKFNIHLPECAAKKTTIDVDQLHEKVMWDDKMNMAIDDAMARSMKHYPEVFVAKEEFPYLELLACQGLPQRINKHFGNDVDGCDHSSDYLAKKPRKKLSDIADNHAEIAAKFKGTKFEDIFASDENRFLIHIHEGIEALSM